MTPRPTSGSSAVPVEAIDRDFVPVRATVASVELDGETVLLDEEGSTIHELSRTATLLWHCLDGKGTVDEIAADVSDAFGTDLTRVRGELIEFVRGLGRKGLLTNSSSTGPDRQ